tara:strand:- start:31051 stop:31341 length:291 start_codon:yes stop_codon:yes gene_type:complete
MRPILLLFSLFFIIVSCEDGDNCDWGEKGTVLFVDVEGGCWKILSDNIVSYEPMNLEEKFKIDSLRIRFEYEIEEEIGSICQVGEFVISITKIEKL